VTEKFSFYSEIDSFQLKQPNKFIEWLLSVCKAENKEIFHVSFVFTSDEKLREINKEYLNHNYYTDVISFPLEKHPIEGDILISIDRVRDNAQQFKVSFDNELHRVMLHGLLHFIGYNDKTTKDSKIMREKENKYLITLA